MTAGTLNDTAARTTHEVDVVAAGPGRELLAIGEVKWGEVMGERRLARLPRILELVRVGDRYDVSVTRLVCFSGVGFTDELRAAEDRGEVVLVGPADLYA